MTKLPSVKPKELISLLESLGWKITRQKGSHIQLKHKDKLNFRVTIPYHNQDIPPSTLHSIIRQMGISRNQFEELLK